MKIKTLKKTCLTCPSQWEGKLDDSSPIYIRYRWGYLSISIGERGKGIDSAINGTEIFGKQIGDSLDGKIELKKVLKLSKLEYENH